MVIFYNYFIGGKLVISGKYCLRYCGYIVIDDENVF